MALGSASRFRFLMSLSLTAVLAALTACGGNATHSSAPPGSTPSPGTSASFDHVFLVVFENHDYADVVGNAAMPYFNSLAQQHALATNFYANTHPSIGNYFMLTTGQIVTNDDSFDSVVNVDNVVRQLIAGSKSWKGYMQSLPQAGYIGGDQYPYIKHHDPLAYFGDVVNDLNQRSNLVPLPQLASDFAANQLPSYALIVPDDQHNGHDCPPGMSSCTDADKLAAMDQWLNATISPLVNNAAFQSNSLLLITFDESATDNTNGGGKIPLVLVGARVKAGFQSGNLYQHQSLLRLAMDALGVSGRPGAAATAPSMSEFLK